MTGVQKSKITRRRGAAAATVAAVFLLAAVTATTPATAQQTDPAAAAAHKAKCDPLVAAIELNQTQQRAAAGRSRDAAAAFDSALAHFKQSHSHYARLRDSGEVLQAWQTMPSVDAAWGRLRGLIDQLIGHRTANASASRLLCPAIARAHDARCVKNAADGCMARLEKLQTSIGDLRSRSARFASTWKTEADLKLNPENAKKGCSIAKAIAPRATVTYIEGRAFVVRAMRTLPVAVGMQLHAGDVLAVEEGSAASINMYDVGVLKISEKTKFEIPDPRNSPPPPSISGQLWTELKKRLEGEKFEIKTPTDACGSRG